MKRLSVLIVTLVAVQAGAQTAPAPAPAAAPATPTATPGTTPPATTTTSTTPPPATASAGSAVLTPEQLAKLRGFFFSVGIDHIIGTGTFVDPALYSSLTANINAFISYRTRLFDKALSIGVQPFGLNGFSYEYTLSNAANGRRLSWSDARVAISMPALIKESNTGIVVTPALNVIIPTTPESWGAGLISRVGFGLSVNKNFKTPVGMFIVNFGGLGTIGLYKNTQAIVTPVKPDSGGRQLVLCREGEQVCGINGNNQFLALQGSLGVTWAATDGIFVSVSYGLLTGFRYAAVGEADAATPKALDANGNPVARTGMVRNADTQSASVSVSFNITDAISGSIYYFNFAPLLTADQKAVRFPFVDVAGIANNNGGFGFSLSAVY